MLCVTDVGKHICSVISKNVIMVRAAFTKTICNIRSRQIAGVKLLGRFCYYDS